jgi:hypothetical protein
MSDELLDYRENHIQKIAEGNLRMAEAMQKVINSLNVANNNNDSDPDNNGEFTSGFNLD